MGKRRWWRWRRNRRWVGGEEEAVEEVVGEVMEVAEEEVMEVAEEEVMEVAEEEVVEVAEEEAVEKEEVEAERCDLAVCGRSTARVAPTATWRGCSCCLRSR